MNSMFEPETSARRFQPKSSGGWEKAGSLRWLLVIGSLWAFLLSQLLVNQGVNEETADILIVKQIDAEEVEVEEEGKGSSDFGLVAYSFFLPSLKEQRPNYEGQSAFQFERLLCLGSRGPPNG